MYVHISRTITMQSFTLTILTPTEKTHFNSTLNATFTKAVEHGMSVKGMGSWCVLEEK